MLVAGVWVIGTKFILKEKIHWKRPYSAIRTLLFIVFIPLYCVLFILLQEYYEFIDSNDVDAFRKLGTFAWLSMAIAFAETLAAIKFGNGLFTAPWPSKVLWAWGTVAVLFAIVFGTWTVRFYSKKKGGKKNIANPATSADSTDSRGKKET